MPGVGRVKREVGGVQGEVTENMYRGQNKYKKRG